MQNQTQQNETSTAMPTHAQADSGANKDPQGKSGKRALILMLVVFMLPVILAKLALEADFFQRKATNQGILMEPSLDFSTISATDQTQQNKWRLLFALPEVCESTCENALYSIQQVRTALGREMDRVMPVVVVTGQSDSDKQQALVVSKQHHLLQAEQPVLAQVFAQSGLDNIYVVDTLDNVVLRYPLQSDSEDAIQHSRLILADLRKLLKLSRIG